MAYVVTDRCIRCKYMDCVDTCPIPCFAEGKLMLVVDPAECIDCGLCEPACPAHAIAHESEQWVGKWPEFNRLYSTKWPKVTNKGGRFPDADHWKDINGKDTMFSSEPAGRENAPEAAETKASGFAAGEA